MANHHRDDVFGTPVLDDQAHSLLQSISEEGGYAYVSMSTRAAAGDIRAAEAAREMAWEQLHSGPWHSVLPVWRDAYSMACLHVAKFHYANGDFREALRVLDMGLIMGGMVLRKDLDSAVEKATERANALLRVSEESVNGSANAKLLTNQNAINLMEVVQSLPKRSLSCKLVGKRSALSLEGFMRDYFLSGSPVLLSDSMTHWPARTKWNDLNYLKKVAGYRTVPVEVGKNYLCTDWKQEMLTFSEFLERIQSKSSAAPTYLAQHPLFDQIQELWNDIVIPDYCFAGGTEMKSVNAWFGPAGTVTPLHHDPHHNILAQVVGKKYVRLYPASLSEELYPHSESMLKNSSQVDLDNMDANEFPKIQDLEFVDCILEEGEMLYIPPKWWHYVRSLTTSLSVSFWWSAAPSSPTS
ncbi:lysine-specific demethylase JMJ30 isoform X2 [Cynara cardunculus var. scolymus]|uniref:lysine-specific demethylase JMJ30 isoform X2 n=1 Tax=Cynara cardunculus var. scolymus TaxID=59895 RepID=UPI000D6280C2|nr:lysine-specific demethylase JMJ30 isoform X2 [Cynara cardunculus var. scolymus]